MKISKATLEDVDVLAGMHDDVHGLHLDAEPHVYRRAPPEAVRALFVERMGRSHLEILIAKDSHALGYIVARAQLDSEHVLKHARACMVVDELAVSRQARRRGAGRALLEAVEHRAEQQGLERVVLSVRAFNRDAIAFYRALGFVTDSLRMSRSSTSDGLPPVPRA